MASERRPFVAVLLLILAIVGPSLAVGDQNAQLSQSAAVENVQVEEDDLDLEAIPNEEEKVHGRSKRSLVNFGTMITCGVKHFRYSHSRLVRWVVAISAARRYRDYGCWCGTGGSGQPQDAIDWCCYHHDKCYDRHVHCNPKTNDYRHHCVDRRPKCGPATRRGWFFSRVFRGEQIPQSVLHCIVFIYLTRREFLAADL